MAAASCFSALIATGVGAAAPAARAPMMRVDFDAPAGCCSAEAFRRGVAARLEHAAGQRRGAARPHPGPPHARRGSRAWASCGSATSTAPADTRTVEGRDLRRGRRRAGADRGAGAATRRRAPPPPRSAATPHAPARPPERPADTARGQRRAHGAGAASAGRARRRPRTSPRAGARGPRGRLGRAGASSRRRSRRPHRRLARRGYRSAASSAAANRRAPGAAAAPGHRCIAFEIGAGAAARARPVSSAGSGPGLNLGGGVMLGVAHAREDRCRARCASAGSTFPTIFCCPAPTWSTLERVHADRLSRLGAAPRRARARRPARAPSAAGSRPPVAVTNPRSASRSWFSGGALLRGGADLGAGFSLELEAGVDALLLHRQFYTTTPLETVAETPPVSLLVGIGLSRRL